MAMLEASPSFHCGGTFGHDASTAKVGTARGCCDCALAWVARNNVAATSGTVWRTKVMASSRWPALLIGPAVKSQHSTISFAHPPYALACHAPPTGPALWPAR